MSLARKGLAMTLSRQEVQWIELRLTPRDLVRSECGSPKKQIALDIAEESEDAPASLVINGYVRRKHAPVVCGTNVAGEAFPPGPPVP